jgi:hypothetical protein
MSEIYSAITDAIGDQSAEMVQAVFEGMSKENKDLRVLAGFPSAFYKLAISVFERIKGR